MGKFKLKPPFPPKDGYGPHGYPDSPKKEVVDVDGTDFTVIKIELEPGVAGEANNDGTIFVSEDIPSGSIDEAEVVAHEDKHMKDMESGMLGYGDDWIEWKGKRYERKDGKIKYNGKWVDEGDKNFPWEKRAYNAGDTAVKKLKNKYGRK
jgi:hypothetical protein